MASGTNLSLGEAAGHFLAGLPRGERETAQPVIQHFISWFGRNRLLENLAAPEVAAYAQRLSASQAGYARRLDILRAFLKRAKKEGWSKISLSAHLKSRKAVVIIKASDYGPAVLAKLPVSQQAYDDTRKERDELVRKRPLIVNEIQRAAADKDFRENAPLDAAREQLGHLDGRLKELDVTLKTAVVTKKKEGTTARADIGSSVTLRDLATGQEIQYILVGPRDVNQTGSQISIASPIGRAMLAKSSGEVIEIAVPAGRVRYRIESIG